MFWCSCVDLLVGCCWWEYCCCRVMCVVCVFVFWLVVWFCWRCWFCFGLVLGFVVLSCVGGWLFGCVVFCGCGGFFFWIVYVSVGLVLMLGW